MLPAAIKKQSRLHVMETKLRISLEVKHFCDCFISNRVKSAGAARRTVKQ